jgi:hypothetical protein
VARYHLAVPVNENRNIEAEAFDAAGDLPDLAITVMSGIAWVKLERPDGKSFYQ